MSVTENTIGAYEITGHLEGHSAQQSFTPQKMSDRELYKKCCEYGANARVWQRKFASLLPEVAGRGLYKRYKFYSIYEFAAKIGGMSHSAVDEVLMVCAKLEDKPALKELLPQQGWSKLRVVASVVRPETQKFWVKKVKEMSKNTLETYIKEIRKLNIDLETLEEKQIEITAVNKEVPIPGDSTPTAASQKTAITFKLDEQTETALRIFKQKMEKRNREPLDWNTIIKMLLATAELHKQCGEKTVGKPGNTLSAQSGRKATITKGKNGASPLPETSATVQSGNTLSFPKHPSRYIPAAVKRALQNKYQNKCAYPGCKYPAEILHHTQRFALHPHHNPEYIAPLCKNHENIAHRGLIEKEESSPENWRIAVCGQNRTNSAKAQIDQKVLERRLAVPL